MFLFLLMPAKGTGDNYYDSMLVCAANEDEARNIHPRAGEKVHYIEHSLDGKIITPEETRKHIAKFVIVTHTPRERISDGWDIEHDGCWACIPEDVEVRLIGIAVDDLKPGIVTKSYTSLPAWG